MFKPHYGRRSGPRQDKLVIRAQCGKVIAQVLTDRAGRRFSLKYVVGSKHQLRTPPAWGYDKAALRDAERLGVQYHVIADREANRSYCAWHSDFEEHGFDLFRWDAPQRGLGLAFWHVGTTPPPVNASLLGELEAA